jgi:hypothetical protein
VALHPGRRSLSVLAVVLSLAAVAARPAMGRALQPSLPGPLYGVDAISADDVWAVGSRPNPNDPDETVGLAVHWDGAGWRELGTPGFGELAAGLLDVSASSSSDVWAVGSAGQPSFRDKQIVVEHWDGAGWSKVQAPNPSFNDALFGVVAISQSDAWAVGGYDTGGTALNHMLIEHWDGHAWSVVPTPAFPPGALNAVDATSASDVWAVGGGGGRTFAMHFDGTRWSKVPTPDHGTAVQGLNDVSALASNDAWAVGTIDAGRPFSGQTLAMHWDGVAWRPVRTPTPASGDEVTSVSALPGGRAWMVGSFWPDALTGKPLTERLAGDRGTVVRAPGQASLEGVAAVAPDDVWAVGSAIYHWDGVAWRIVVGPS